MKESIKSQSERRSPEEMLMIYDILDRLDELCQKILYTCLVVGYTERETAQIFHLPRSTVHKRKKECLARFIALYRGGKDA